MHFSRLSFQHESVWSSLIQPSREQHKRDPNWMNGNKTEFALIFYPQHTKMMLNWMNVGNFSKCFLFLFWATKKNTQSSGNRNFEQNISMTDELVTRFHLLHQLSQCYWHEIQTISSPLCQMQKHHFFPFVTFTVSHYIQHPLLYLSIVFCRMWDIRRIEIETGHCVSV